jgi:hypothetical protein
MTQAKITARPCGRFAKSRRRAPERILPDVPHALLQAAANHAGGLTGFFADLEWMV